LKNEGNGFYLETEEKRLVSHQIQVQKGTNNWVKWFNKEDNHDMDYSSNWDITHVSENDDPNFIISHPYMSQPRLIPYVFEPDSHSYLIASSKRKDGYDE